MAYRFRKRPSEKAKFHDSVVSHPNANVRLAADQIAFAAKAAKDGNIQDFMTYVSLAKRFLEDVNFNNPVENFN